MNIDKKELLFIYNSQKTTDRTALSYAEPIKEFKLKEFDISKDFFTELQLKEIASLLKVQSKELIDTTSDVYRDKYANSKLSETDLLTVLKHEPSMMRTPIALYHDRGEFVTSSYDFIKKDMATPASTVKSANKEEKSS
jgi:arsenate reductase